MECNGDCLNCIFDDCIADEKEKKVRKTDRKAYNKAYYQKNKYVIKARAIERARRKKKVECANCFKDITEPQMIYKYKRKVFCSTECLKEWLLERAYDDVEEVWHDTKENMRICAEEEGAKW